MIRRAVMLLALVAVAAGCASTLSLIDRGSGPAQMYPVTAEAADKIIAAAMASEFAGSPISRLEFPAKGYQATVRFTPHTVLAYMIPAKGRNAGGEVVNGYVFEVSHSDTPAVSGRARRVYDRIIRDATRVSQPLPLASSGP